VRIDEAALLVYGAMVGFAWAMVALLVATYSAGQLPGIVHFTILLPLTTMFLLAAWLRPSFDALALLFLLGVAYGVLCAGAVAVCLRLRDV
jgi:hypothetical protein